MSKMEAYRKAVAELGDASAEALSAFIKSEFSITVEPEFIPVFRASLQDLEKLHPQRKAATNPTESVR